MGTRYGEDRIYLGFRGATRDVNYLIDQLEKQQLLLQSYDGIQKQKLINQLWSPTMRRRKYLFKSTII